LAQSPFPNTVPPNTQFVASAPLLSFTVRDGSLVLTSASDLLPPPAPAQGKLGPAPPPKQQGGMVSLAELEKIENENRFLQGRLNNLQCQLQANNQSSTGWTTLATDAGVLGLSLKGFRAGAVNGATVEGITSELLKLRVPLATAEKYAPEILKALRSPVATGVFLLGMGVGGVALVSKLSSDAAKPRAQASCPSGLQFPLTPQKAR